MTSGTTDKIDLNDFPEPPMPDQLRIPDQLLDPNISLEDAAHALAEGGLHVLATTSAPTARKPDTDASKNPGSLHGRNWQHAATRNRELLTLWFNPDTRQPGELPPRWYRDVPTDTIRMGIKAGPDIVILDIDHPDHVPAQHWAELTQAPHQTSNPRDPHAGHYYFLATPGTHYGQTTAIKGTTPANSPGEIRHGNAYAACAPSKHAKPTHRYQWVQTGVIPAMSPELAEWLHSEHQTTQWCGTTLDITPASVATIQTAREEHTTATHPGILQEHLGQTARWCARSNLHTGTLTKLIDAIQLAVCGYFPYGETVDTFRSWFIGQRTNPNRGDGSWTPNVSGEDAAAAEFEDMLAWAMGKVTAKLTTDTGPNGPDPEHTLQYETAQYAANQFGIPPTIAAPEALPSTNGSAPANGETTIAELETIKHNIENITAETLSAETLLVNNSAQPTITDPGPIPDSPLPPTAPTPPIAPPPGVHLTSAIDYAPGRTPVEATHRQVTVALTPHLENKLLWCTDQAIWYAYNEHTGLWEGNGTPYTAVAAAIVNDALETRIQPVKFLTYKKAIKNAQLSGNDREADRLETERVARALTPSDRIAVPDDAWAENHHNRDAILKDLRSQRELQIHSSEFDSTPHRYPVGNGVLDLTPLHYGAKPTLLPDGPEHYITYRTTTNYDPEAPTPTAWNELLNTAFDDPAVGNFIAEWFGMGIAKVKNYGKFLYAFGRSHSGKGLIFNVGTSLVFGTDTNNTELLDAVTGETTPEPPATGRGSRLGRNTGSIGSLVETMNKSYILKSSGLSNDNARLLATARLRGKAIAYIDEIGDGGMVDTDFLKSYTGGANLPGRKMYEGPTLIAVPPLVISSNHEWSISNVDSGSGNRMIALEFKYGHGEGSTVPDDPTLEPRIRSEASGILNWALAGYMRWHNAGLNIPGSVQAQTTAMTEASSEFGTYLAEAFDVVDTHGDSTVLDATYVDFGVIWRGWIDRETGYVAKNISRGTNPSPRAIRLITKSLKEFYGSNPHITISIPVRKDQPKRVYGLRLNEIGMSYLPVGSLADNNRSMRKGWL